MFRFSEFGLEVELLEIVLVISHLDVLQIEVCRTPNMSKSILTNLNLCSCG